MAIATKSRDQKRLLNTFIALLAILSGYVFILFFEQLNVWFELEATIANYVYISQGFGVVLGLITFVLLKRIPSSSMYIDEVFQEVLKVVWPEKNETVRMTIGIIIGVVIAGCFLAVFDVISSKLLSLVH